MAAAVLVATHLMTGGPALAGGVVATEPSLAPSAAPVASLLETTQQQRLQALAAPPLTEALAAEDAALDAYVNHEAVCTGVGLGVSGSVPLLEPIMQGPADATLGPADALAPRPAPAEQQQPLPSLEELQQQLGAGLPSLDDEALMSGLKSVVESLAASGDGQAEFASVR
jgi:hypothetical protein